MGQLEKIVLPDGRFVVIAQGVDPTMVDPQPGDPSLLTAQSRAIPLVEQIQRGERVAPPLLRLRPNGRYEIWDGNARVAAHRQAGRPIDAIVVSESGEIARARNIETVPLDHALWEQLVAQARAIGDAADPPFRWPSLEARGWVEREYVAAGGSFGQRRARVEGRRITQLERHQIRLYGSLFAQVDTAQDLYALAEILGQAQSLESPTLRGTITKLVVNAAQRMGFRCPVKATRDACGNALLEYAGTRQGRLFNLAQDERRALWPKWRQSVNMSAQEIQTFLDSPAGQDAGLSRDEASEQEIRRGRDSARALLRMLPTGGRSYAQAERNWSRNDWEWAKAQYQFIARMRGVQGPLFKKGQMTPKMKALMIWGYDPRKRRRNLGNLLR